MHVGKIIEIEWSPDCTEFVLLKHFWQDFEKLINQIVAVFRHKFV